jgi:hypothetical protein
VNGGWIVDPKNLVRGLILEAEVQLEADAIFRMNTVFSSLLEILEENPEMFELDDGFIQAKSAQRILAKLLVGLVPVRGLAVDYKVVKLGEKEWIVHQKLLNELPAAELPPTYSLYIVGVAEQSLFWKDIRRILFSKLRFRVLCRLAQDSIQDSWTPVKLVHVLETVMPDIANQINAIGSMAGASNQNSELKQQFAHDTLVSYAKLLADHYDHNITEDELYEAGLPSEQHCKSFGSQKERREAFEEISTFVLKRFNIEREPDIVAQFREVALQDANPHLSGQPTSPVTSTSSSTNSDERFLDSEIIAIYW